MISNIKNNIYKKLYRSKIDSPEPHTLKNKFNFINKSPTYYFQKFGNKNKGKIFYVIKIYEKIKEGGGLFSNLLFVLHHLKIVEKLNVIPVIDMENFYNRYNEVKPVKGIKNSWLYYFEKISKYDLKEVYNSNKVLITSGFLILLITFWLATSAGSALALFSLVCSVFNNFGVQPHKCQYFLSKTTVVRGPPRA